MKTDLERFVELYKSFGIECIVENVDGGFNINLCAETYSMYEVVTLSEKFEGYHGFYSRVCFDTQGNFIEQGFWE